MSKVAVIYEGDKSLLDKDLMSQIDGEPEFYEVNDKTESVVYRILKQAIQLGLIASVFFIAPAHVNTGDAEEKISTIHQAVGVKPQTIRSSEAVAKKVPQFGFAKGMIEMSDDFDEPLDAFRDYMT